MSTEDLIPMELYFQHEELDITFVRALTDRGLIELVIREERSYLAPEQITRLESLARMHFCSTISAARPNWKCRSSPRNWPSPKSPISCDGSSGRQP